MQRSLIAILVSLTGLIFLLKINYNIASIWNMSGAKTRALFSMVEFGFLYKYCIAAFGIIAIILSVQAYRKQENKKWMITASVLSSFAFAATFIRLWKFMLWMP